MWVERAIKIGFCVSLSCTLPLLQFAMRESLVGLLGLGSGPSSGALFYGSTLALLARPAARAPPRLRRGRRPGGKQAPPEPLRFPRRPAADRGWSTAFRVWCRTLPSRSASSAAPSPSCWVSSSPRWRVPTGSHAAPLSCGACGDAWRGSRLGAAQVAVGSKQGRMGHGMLGVGVSIGLVCFSTTLMGFIVPEKFIA